MEKLIIVAISLNLLTESLSDGWTGNSNDGFVYIFIIVGAEEFLARDVMYTSCAYAAMSVSICLSVRLSVCL